MLGAGTDTNLSTLKYVLVVLGVREASLDQLTLGRLWTQIIPLGFLKVEPSPPPLSSNSL